MDFSHAFKEISSVIQNFDIKTFLSARITTLDAKQHIQQTYAQLARMMVITSFASYLYSNYSLFRSFHSLSFLLLLGSLVAFQLSPVNNIVQRTWLLYAFALGKGLSIAPLLEHVGMRDQSAVFLACSYTAILFGCFTLAAFYQPQNMYPTALAASVAGIYSWSLFIGMFVRSQSMYSMELYLGLAMFSLYCIADTQQMILRANRGEKDRLGDAMRLYIDVISLFVKVLILISRKNEDRQDKRERRRTRANI